MKKKNIFILVFIFIILGVIGLTLWNYMFNKQTKLSKVFDPVYDLGDYKTLNYSYAKEFYKNQNDNWGGKCSAVAKNLENGDTIVGRNMDLNISNKNAYIFRTKLEKTSNKTKENNSNNDTDLASNRPTNTNGS